MNPSNQSAGAVTDALLDRLRGELRGAIAKRIGWQTAAVIGVGLWLVLALDRTFEPSAMVRSVVGSAAGLAALGWLALVAAPRVLLPIRDGDLLSLLNRRRPREAALIATALDLRTKGSAANPRLTERTIREADRAAESLGEETLVRHLGESGWPAFAVVALAGLAGLAAVRGDLAATLVRRLALSEEAWPRRVELMAEGFAFDSATGEWRRHAPRGEPVELTVTASVSAGATPRTVWSRSGSSTRLSALTRVGRAEASEGVTVQRFRRRVERLDGDHRMTLWGGDGRLRLRVLATDRPKLTGVTVLCEPPAYLGQPKTEASLATLDTLPEGSLVTLRGRSTRGLVELSPIVQGEGEAPVPIEGTRLLEEGQAFEVTLPPLRRSQTVTLSATDTLGLASEPTEFALDCVADRPPSVSLTLDGIGRAVTRDAVVAAKIRVEDDHGLAAVALRIEAGERRLEIDAPPPRAPAGVVAAEADLLSLRAAGERGLALGVGDRVRLSAVVEDAYDLEPREPTSSQAIELEVVTPAELLARLGESQRELRGVVETLRDDAQRLAYEIGLQRRRLEEGEESEGGEAEENVEAAAVSPWAAERALDARKAARGVSQAAERADGLRRQVIVNRLEQPALVDRLEAGVVGPLRRVERRDLAKAEERLAEPGVEESLAEAESAAMKAAETLGRVAESLDSQQTYNEVVSLLRGLIREQRRVNERTSKQQADRVRSLFD